MTREGPGRAGRWMMALVAALLGVAIGAGAMYAASGHFVRAYLLENPEILPEAMDRLRARESAQAVDRYRSALETPYEGAWAGAADGDVVLVQFFDYACGYCRASNADVDRLLAEDPRLKVVWRDFPVLGPDSEQAAVASLAAAEAGRFLDYHNLLFASGRPEPANVARAARTVGLADTELTERRRAELTANFELGRAIGATGTPTFVVGDEVLQGAVGYEALKAAVSRAREGG